jgi:hypothetical protein
MPEKITMDKRHHNSRHNSASRNSIPTRGGKAGPSEKILPKSPLKSPPKSSRPKLLQTRRDSAHQLGISIWQVIELEKRGVLSSVRLTNSPSARSYNIVSEVEALARGEKLQHGTVGRDNASAQV